MARLKINSDIIEDISLVIFDKDGTLMDLYTYWSNMVAFRADLAQSRLGFDDAHKKEIMYAMGVDLLKGRLRPEGPVGLKKREIVMQAMIDSLAAIGFPDMYQICFDIFKEVDEVSSSRFATIVKPIGGLHKLIGQLRRQQCKVAIATTDKSERARLAMKFLGISNDVCFIAGDEMVEHSKPAPDMAQLILRNTGVSPDNAAVIGDTVSDVEMGINAGLKAAIGVASGLTPFSELLRRTRYVARNISFIEVSGN